MNAPALLPPAAKAAAMFDLPRPAAECRIVVAMSGGVDSSVVAALAHASGAEVIGITLQLYDYGAATGRKGACCAGDARSGRPPRHRALRLRP
jgi:tRNA-specific 2-thiouridylase